MVYVIKIGNSYLDSDGNQTSSQRDAMNIDAVNGAAAMSQAMQTLNMRAVKIRPRVVASSTSEGQPQD